MRTLHEQLQNDSRPAANHFRAGLHAHRRGAISFCYMDKCGHRFPSPPPNLPGPPRVKKEVAFHPLQPHPELLDWGVAYARPVLAPNKRPSAAKVLFGSPGAGNVPSLEHTLMLWPGVVSPLYCPPLCHRFSQDEKQTLLKKQHLGFHP